MRQAHIGVYHHGKSRHRKRFHSLNDRHDVFQRAVDGIIDHIAEVIGVQCQIRLRPDIAAFVGAEIILFMPFRLTMQDEPRQLGKFNLRTVRIHDKHDISAG